MAVWPASLQQTVNVNSFEKRLGSTSIRSEMDVGPAKVRSRFTDAVDVYTVSIYLDYDEYSTFDTFFKTTINNGVDPFEFDDPFTGNAADFRFVETPVIRPLGGRFFQVNMTWEKLP